MRSLLAVEAAGSFVSIDVPAWGWVALTVGVVGLLLLDLLLVHRTPHDITVREALVESAVWIAIALAFGILVAQVWGWGAAGEYYSGYLIEKSLSIDNVFVWAVIFSVMGVPQRYQFRVLFWGVFGALVLRAVFVLAGVALLERFSWLLYVFGALLLFTAYRLWNDDDHAPDPGDSRVLRLVGRVVPSTTELHGQRMFVRENGRLLATPLFTVLLLVEVTDVIFAVDSVPAILAVSREPFIVISSNAFAILGLRALYFALAGMKDRFRYLDEGLAAILVFVGTKMLLLEVVHVPTSVSVTVIAVILTIAVLASLRAEGDSGGDGALAASLDGITIRDAAAADRAAVEALNAANVPEVGPLDSARWELFLSDAATFWVAERDGELLAIFVGLYQGAAYGSPNYAWFARRHRRFAYVDRIAVAPSARGTGLAQQLYDRWVRAAHEHGADVVCAEVNTEPPNPRSMTFHERQGFVRVEETEPYGDGDRVAMLELDIRRDERQ